MIATKGAVGHGNFLPWIEAEFAMAERTARRFMESAEVFGSKSATVADLPATILYALAAPSTPETIRSLVGSPGRKVPAAPKA